MTVWALAGAVAGARAAGETVQLPPGSVEEFMVPSGLYEDTSLVVDLEGDIWFNEANPGKVGRIAPTGVLTGEFVPFSGAGIQPYWPEYSEPSGLAVAPDGDVWFTERGTNNEGKSFIEYFTPTGRIANYPIPTTSSRPGDIALGPDEAMWFTEEESGKIGRIAENGTISEFTIPSTDRSEYLQPREIALGSDGNLWFTDWGLSDDGQNLIGRITPQGDIIKEFSIPAPYDTPDAIALGADGNIWFTESTNAIGRITPAGVFTEFPVPSVSGSPRGLALGRDGNMWFTESTNAIGRITPAGTVTSFAGASAAGGALGALVTGREGDLWYVTGGRLARLATPLAPLGVALPTLSGQAEEGGTLTAVSGTWSNAPTTFAYQWQACDATGANCADLAGATETTLALGSADVGHTFRVSESAVNIAGAAAATSAVSAVVQALPPALSPSVSLAAPAPAPAQRPSAVEPLPVIASAMTWNFAWGRKYTLVEALVVHDVPVGALIEVACRGGGCAFAHWRSNASTRACRHDRCKSAGLMLARGQISLATLFDSRHLQIGTRLTVTVAKPGWIGKSFVFTVRADKPPRVQITCLGSGPSNPAGGC